jgi:hypothetical protein
MDILGENNVYKEINSVQITIRQINKQVFCSSKYKYNIIVMLVV